MFSADIPAGPAGETVRRVVDTIGNEGIACELPLAIDGDRIRVRFGGHHSNELILAMLAGLADPEVAESVQASQRLANLIGLIPRLDSQQRRALSAFARSTQTGPFADSLASLLHQENLNSYFEIDDQIPIEAGREHHRYRPVGYIQHRQDSIAAQGNPGWDVFEAIREKAQAERMDEGRRVALVTALALYNSTSTAHCFKGRGWLLRAGALGRYLRTRIEKAPFAYEAYIQMLLRYRHW